MWTQDARRRQIFASCIGLRQTIEEPTYSKAQKAKQCDRISREAPVEGARGVVVGHAEGLLRIRCYEGIIGIESRGNERFERMAK